MVNQNQTIGYLPDERPPVWKLLLYALQQVIALLRGNDYGQPLQYVNYR